jgi:arylsulfatase A-like enzyme
MPFVQTFIRQQGVTFPNSMVPTPLCCPSRTSFLTGRYSHETGVYGNHAPHGGWPTFNQSGGESSTLATWLDSAGYETALVGKYLNDFDRSDPAYTPPGWDTFVGHLRGGYFYNYTLRTKVGGLTRDVDYGKAPQDYSTDVLAAQAVDTIESTPSDRPLFMVFTPMAPHSPTTPAPRDVGSWPWEPPTTPDVNETDMSDKPPWMQALPPVDQPSIARKTTLQHESLMAVDDAVEAIVTALGDRASNTLFVFTSDNGLMLGSHRMTGKGTPHARSAEVPLMLRWDGHLDPAVQDRRIALNIDVTATILQAARVKQQTSGSSLLRPRNRSGTVLEGLGIDSRGSPPYCAWRTRRWLFVEWSGYQGRELYDYRADPYELQNLAEDPGYRTQLLTLRRQARADCNPVPPGFTW